MIKNKDKTRRKAIEEAKKAVKMLLTKAQDFKLSEEEVLEAAISGNQDQNPKAAGKAAIKSMLETGLLRKKGKYPNVTLQFLPQNGNCKFSYPSRGAAIEASRKMKGQKQVYQCAECGCFHIQQTNQSWSSEKASHQKTSSNWVEPILPTRQERRAERLIDESFAVEDMDLFHIERIGDDDLRRDLERKGHQA